VVVESTACLMLDLEAMHGTNQAVRHRKLIDHLEVGVKRGKTCDEYVVYTVSFTKSRL
jgi:hypothetical protein